MKIIPLLGASAVMAFCGGFLQVQAEGPPQPPKPVVNIQVTVDFLEIETALANQILHGDKVSESSAEFYAVKQELLEDKATESLASLSVMTQSGQRASTTSVHEKIYATEFSAPKGRAEHSPAVPTTVSAVDVPSPTAYEMRPVGATVEVDPVLDPTGKTITLNLAPELTFDFGQEPVLEIPGVEKPAISMPHLYTLKTTTSVDVPDGGTMLIGGMLPPNEKGVANAAKRVLLFVTARVIRG